MRIRLDKDVLADAVAWAARSLPARPPAPILAGLLLKAEGDTVVLSCFDYETSARVTVPAEVSEPGVALVSGRLLAEITRSLPNRAVALTSSDSKLDLVCGSARFTLQLLPVEQYPELPQMPDATGSVSSGDFSKAVGQVVVAAGRDELLPVFTGVRIEIHDDQLSLLATDRYRMALRELDWQPQGNPTGAALVPARVLGETARSMTTGDSITLSLSSAATGEGLIGFEGQGPAGTRQMTTRLLDGDFPKVRHLMNIQAALGVRAQTDDLIAAVKRVSLVAERNTSLRMLIGDDSITLDASTGDQAQASEVLVAMVDNVAGGEPAVVAAGFNPTYLTDALTALDAPYVQFAFTAPGKPCLVTGLAELDGEPITDYKHVIMLMRLPS